MDLKRRLLALAVVVVLAPLGASTKTLATGAPLTHAEQASHGDGDESGEADGDDPGGRGNDEGARDPNRHENSGDDDADDRQVEGSCTSASSVTVCADEPGVDEPGVDEP